jgi:hypothetical protein
MGCPAIFSLKSPARIRFAAEIAANLERTDFSIAIETYV